MSWQTPGGDPPTDPAAPSPSDPVTPSSEPLLPETTPEPAPVTSPPGLISAAPVGWGAGSGQPASSAPADGPVVAWAQPAPTTAVSMGDGFVVAGVFSRLVAYLIDVAFIAAINLVAFGLLGPGPGQGISAGWFAVTVVLLAFDAIYFVGLWRSGWQATIGMRLIGLRVRRVVDGGTLSLNAGITRWFAVTGLTQILIYVPVLGPLLALLWDIALLLTTATNPLRQGLHDRWAGSVVVQRAPGGSGAAVIGCLVLVVVVIALPFVLLAMASDQLLDILSQVGNSI